MKLVEMRQLLERRGIQLTRSLGQSFLHDQNQLDRIVAAAELTPAEPVLEIGPGLGPLTERLLVKASHVLAIEMDARLVAVLRDRFAGASRLELLHADALAHLRGTTEDWRAWKVVSNLPYSVASPILVELAQAPQPPARLVVTLQREVADRLRAGPGNRDYGVLTLLVQIAYEPRDWFRIPSTCFFPEPDVESAAIVLRRRAQPLLPAEQRRTFTRLVKLAFSQRRKMMFKLLKTNWPTPALNEAFVACHIDAAERAEEVSLHQFVQLTQLLSPCPKTSSTSSTNAMK